VRLYYAKLTQQLQQTGQNLLAQVGNERGRQTCRSISIQVPGISNRAASTLESVSIEIT